MHVPCLSEKNRWWHASWDLFSPSSIRKSLKKKRCVKSGVCKIESCICFSLFNFRCKSQLIYSEWRITEKILLFTDSQRSTTQAGWYLVRWLTWSQVSQVLPPSSAPKLMVDEKALETPKAPLWLWDLKRSSWKRQEAYGGVIPCRLKALLLCNTSDETEVPKIAWSSTITRRNPQATGVKPPQNPSKISEIMSTSKLQPQNRLLRKTLVVVRKQIAKTNTTVI